MSLRIGIAGITGQVGRLLIDEIGRAGATLSGGTIRPASSKSVPPGIATFTDLEELAAVSDVVIDFTHADVVIPNARALTAKKTAWVIGTSGLTAADEAAMQAAAKTIPVLYAPSFAPTAVLTPELVTTLASSLPTADYDVEILETHHKHKVDAPSGVAIAVGKHIAKARGQVFDEVAVLGLEASRSGTS